MKILVIGKGLAATGLVWELVTSEHRPKSSELIWVGPRLDKRDAQNCALRSTALVARQGISSGISPLGDLLVHSYELAKIFFENHTTGIKKVVREHYASSEEKREQLQRRFDCLDYPVKEEAYIIEPLTFLSQWHEEIKTKGPHIEMHDDLLGEAKEGIVQGLKGEYDYDILFDCRGSSLKDYNLIKDNFKKSPGHYLIWNHPDFDHSLKSESWVLTIDGHNLIYHHDRDELILGGSTQKDEMISPAFDQLNDQLLAFKKLRPQFSNLYLNEATIMTGIRSKAKKREPYIKEVTPGHFLVGGFYKNGYTLCFGVAKELIKQAFLNEA